MTMMQALWRKLMGSAPVKAPAKARTPEFQLCSVSVHEFRVWRWEGKPVVMHPERDVLVFDFGAGNDLGRYGILSPEAVAECQKEEGP